MDDGEDNDDKSDIGYISDASTDNEIVGKSRKRKTPTKPENRNHKKAKNISRKQVRIQIILKNHNYLMRF